MNKAYAKVDSTGGTGATTLPGFFVRYHDSLQEALRRAIPSGETELRHMLWYHMGWEDEKGCSPGDSSSQGKALRPSLCLLVCEALGGDWRRALSAAVALELLHNFSLIHDDIQDGDTKRRHRPTVWYLWGRGKAVVAGSALCTHAYAALEGLPDRGFPPETRLRASELLSAACLEMIEGQYLDLSYENRLDIGVEDYLGMVSRKTGALIQCATELGALLADSREEVIRPMARCGRSLGLAFQIRDDILGIWGDSARTGKAAGNDIWRRKKSLPVVYALEHASGTALRDIIRIYAGPSVDGRDVERVLSILEEVEAWQHSQALARAKAAEALDAARQCGMSPWGLQEMETLVDFLVSRDY